MLRRVIQRSGHLRGRRSLASKHGEERHGRGYRREDRREKEAERRKRQKTPKPNQSGAIEQMANLGGRRVGRVGKSGNVNLLWGESNEWRWLRSRKIGVSAVLDAFVSTEQLEHTRADYSICIIVTTVLLLLLLLLWLLLTACVSLDVPYFLVRKYCVCVCLRNHWRPKNQNHFRYGGAPSTFLTPKYGVPYLSL